MPGFGALGELALGEESSAGGPASVDGSGSSLTLVTPRGTGHPVEEVRITQVTPQAEVKLGPHIRTSQVVPQAEVKLGSHLYISQVIVSVEVEYPRGRVQGPAVQCV